MVGKTALDADGALLTAIRAAVGEQTKIVATIDWHANVSPAMLKATDALVGPQPARNSSLHGNPQLGAELLVRSIRGEVRLTQAAAWPPVVISNDRQARYESPVREACARLPQELAESHVLAGSVLLGFPYADVPHMGPSFVVITDNAPLLARRSAKNLADYVVEGRQSFQSSAVSVE